MVMPSASVLRASTTTRDGKGACLATELRAWLRTEPPFQTQCLCRRSEGLGQIVEAVGDVDDQDAVLGQPVEIELYRFDRRQMNRDRVRTVGVDDQDVEL